MLSVGDVCVRATDTASVQPTKVYHEQPDHYTNYGGPSSIQRFTNFPKEAPGAPHRRHVVSEAGPCQGAVMQASPLTYFNASGSGCEENDHPTLAREANIRGPYPAFLKQLDSLVVVHAAIEGSRRELETR